MSVDPRTLAWFGLSGTLCDALGGVYLTFDLLGGNKGPLGLLTRAATYGVVFALGYGLAFGPFFGIVAGIGLGGILAFEFWRVAYHQRVYGRSPLYEIRMSGMARGLVIGLSSAHRFGWRFGGVFGLLNALFLLIAYQFRYAPTFNYNPSPKIGLSAQTHKAALARGLAIGLAGAATGWIVHGRVWAVGFGLAIGGVVGLVGLVLGAISPRIEWWVENLPERTLASFGFALIIFGLLLQSVQYAAVLLPH